MPVEKMISLTPQLAGAAGALTQASLDFIGGWAIGATVDVVFRASDKFTKVPDVDDLVKSVNFGDKAFPVGAGVGAAGGAGIGQIPAVKRLKIKGFGGGLAAAFATGLGGATFTVVTEAFKNNK